MPHSAPIALASHSPDVDCPRRCVAHQQHRLFPGQPIRRPIESTALIGEAGPSGHSFRKTLLRRDSQPSHEPPLGRASASQDFRPKGRAGFLLALLCAAVACGSQAARAQNGTGLTGKYYDYSNFTTLKTTRPDALINFNWGAGVPGGTAITDGEYFSVAWSGQIEPQFSELYTFHVTADDGARLWVDDQCIAARTFFQGTGEMRGQIKLKGGHRVNIRLEYLELTGNSSVKLEWASPSQPRQVVPTVRLYPTTAIPNGGSVLREVWTGQSGSSLTTLTSNASYPNKPASREFLTSFECLAQSWEDSFGTRVTGFIRAPVSGNYTFAVSGDDVAEFYLSTDASSANKALIASTAAPTAFRDFAASPSQQSAPRALVAGNTYYVELLHKESTGSDHWSVGWKLPGDSAFSIIPGSALMQPGVDKAQPATSDFFNTLCTEQPRLGVSRERFLWLRQMYQSPTSSNAKTRAAAVISKANSDLTAALTTQRAARDMVQRLALAWWLTQDPQYAEAAWNQINNSITKGDWADPWKGVENGVVAIGYDWLYPYWSQSRKTAMTNKMVSGFNSGWTDSYSNNIGVIINGGHLEAMLAVGLVNEAAAEGKMGTAISRLNTKVNRWNANAGAWYEGTDYGIFTKWGFGQAMPAMEMALGSTFGLSKIVGISSTAKEPLTIASNNRQRFTFSDVGTGSEAAIGWANWFARRYNALETFDYSRQVGQSPLNALTLPETTLSPSEAGMNPDTAFRGPADAAGGDLCEVVTMRQNWTDPKATFIGGMGGTYESHGHLQSGTFQLSARGVKWFIDLSSESYSVKNHNTTTPNSTGVDRWDYYRWRAEGHNCLVVNPTAGPDRIWNAPPAPLVNYQSAQNGQRSFAVWDLSKNISGVTKVQRGIQLLNGRKEVLVQDEIVTPGVSTVWWYAHFQSTSTPPQISADGKSVLLTSGSERLWGKIVSGGGVWTVRPASALIQTNNPAVADTPNTGKNKLAVQLTGVTNTTLAVWFVPLAPGENPPVTTPAITTLSSWDLVAQSEPPTVRNGFATSIGGAAVDVDLRPFAGDDWTPATRLTFAVSTPTGGTVSLLPDGFTARFTPASGFSGDQGFSFTATDEDGTSSIPGTISIAATPVVSTWTNTAGGSWSTAGNWLEDKVPASGRGADIRFFSGQSVPAGTINISNNTAGSFAANQLHFSGTGTATTVVNLSGNPLRLVSNGSTPPAITLSGLTSGYRFNIANPILLDEDVLVNANNSGTFIFSGAISGNGGITRSGIYGTLILSGDNSYTGTTTISAGTLQVGNDGATGTLGLGPVSIASGATLRIDRTGTLEIPNDIGGSGSVLLHCPSVSHIVRLTGDNTFGGEVRITGGTLRVTDAAQLGAGAKNIVVNTVSSALRLDGSAGDVVLPAEFSIITSSDSGAIIHEAGNNVIEGPLTLAAGGGNTRIISTAGTLTLNGTITPNTTARTLDLRGAGTGAINGHILDAAAPNALAGITKSEAGTWTLNGNNSITGNTTVSGGSLFVNGQHTTSAVSVSSGATLGGRGSIIAPITVNGTLSPGDGIGTLQSNSSIAFGPTARVRWELGANSLSGDQAVAAGALTVAAGAKIDVVLNAPGSAVNFLHSFWRSPRSFPVVGAASSAGTFALGTVSTDAGGRAAATYGTFSLQHTATGANLVWTPVPGFPVIDDPSVALQSPSGAFVSIRDTATSLRLAGSVTNATGASAAWTAVSGPGQVTFENAGSPDTTARFSMAGTYVLRLTASNELGSATTDVTVMVGPAESVTLRHGLDGASHPATFLRSDAASNLTWNSGGRDQVIVGNSDAFRALLSFDLGTVDPSLAVESVTLDLWTSSQAGSGTVGGIDLHALASTFVEGNGNSSTSPDSGSGSGADWITSDGSNAWDSAGGDFDPSVLSTTAGFNATLTRVQRRFNSTAALVSAVQSAAGSEEPLNLMIRSASSAPGNYARLGSNDDSSDYRPLLTITYVLNSAPSVDPGAAPAATASLAAPLIGTAASANSTLWSKLSGPGTVAFANPSLPATSATFSEPGAYVLRLRASNSHGQSSRDLIVNVGPNPAAFADWQASQWPGVTDQAIIGPDADPDGDGLANLLEFASGLPPTSASTSPVSLAATGSPIVFSYRRSHAAVAGGFQFFVEWSDTLGNDWSTAGVTQSEVAGSDEGTARLWQASLPAGSTGKRFVRLRVTR